MGDVDVDDLSIYSMALDASHPGFSLAGRRPGHRGRGFHDEGALAAAETGDADEPAERMVTSMFFNCSAAPLMTSFTLPGGAFREGITFAPESTAGDEFYPLKIVSVPAATTYRRVAGAGGPCR
jgi:hypothetical protein